MKKIVRIVALIDCSVLILAVSFIMMNWNKKQVQADVKVAASEVQTPQESLYLVATTSLYTVEHVSSDKIHSEALVSILKKIAHCESDNDPLAKNPNSSAKGLLQILDGTWQDFHCAGNILNAQDNMQCGLKIATESGLSHWDQSKSCWIKLVQ